MYYEEIGIGKQSSVDMDTRPQNVMCETIHRTDSGRPFPDAVQYELKLDI